VGLCSVFVCVCRFVCQAGALIWGVEDCLLWISFGIPLYECVCLFGNTILTDFLSISSHPLVKTQ
jgi:hypothetical protein